MTIVTHEHTDHYKGIEELSEKFEIEQLVRRQIAGNLIKVSDKVYIRTIWPETIDEEKGQDENKNCSVFMVYFFHKSKEFRILVTGDLDVEGEKGIIKKYGNTDFLKADILKIGHHGSHTSTSEDFLNAVDPDYAVIQCGKNNYGHPSPKTIEKCTKKGIIVLRNDYNGAIGFSFFGKGISVHKMI